MRPCDGEGRGEESKGIDNILRCASGLSRSIWSLSLSLGQAENTAGPGSFGGQGIGTNRGASKHGNRVKIMDPAAQHQKRE